MSRRSFSRSVEKERFWREVLRRHGSSGRSVREFCRGEGLKESAFYFWKRTIAQRDREKRSGGTPKTRRAANGKPRRKPTVAATFIPLSIVGETSRLEIVSPGGWQVRVPNGVDVQTLFDVVTALRQTAGEEIV